MILGLGRSPREGQGSPPQYSCLENPVDRGAWWAAVHGVAKSRTRLSDSHFHFSKYSHILRSWGFSLYFVRGHSSVYAMTTPELNSSGFSYTVSHRSDAAGLVLAFELVSTAIANGESEHALSDYLLGEVWKVTCFNLSLLHMVFK